MEEYLAFVKLRGRTLEGKYIYQFMFTSDPDVVWGDNFNVLPSGIIPNIEPSLNSLTSKGNVYTDSEVITACSNTCFSMQDCIDGIISLCFTPIESEYDFNFYFGEKIKDVRDELDQNGLELVEFEDIKIIEEETEIDSLVEKLKEGNEDGSEDIEF